MAYPKIVYASTTLTFSYPAVQKPGADEKQAVRHDSITSSGLRQSILERTDTFRTLQLDFVPMADLAYWASFMDYALAGGAFDYYPDASSGTHDSWLLEDDAWAPAFAMRGFAKFKIKMRKAV